MVAALARSPMFLSVLFLSWPRVEKTADSFARPGGDTQFQFQRGRGVASWVLDDGWRQRGLHVRRRKCLARPMPSLRCRRAPGAVAMDDSFMSHENTDQGFLRILEIASLLAAVER